MKSHVEPVAYKHDIDERWNFYLFHVSEAFVLHMAQSLVTTPAHLIEMLFWMLWFSETQTVMI